MDVHKADETFEFDKLTLTSPNGIVGGSYLAKYVYKGNKGPLYIQTSKTKSKDGIVVAGKKAHIDIVLSNDDTDFVDWIENLVKYSVDLLFERKNMWFTEELDKNMIQDSFHLPIRTYKKGQYLLRVNLELNKLTSHLQPFICKVFDENRHSASIDYIKPENQFISIIEFQGIKFTNRNFQIELLLRQVLVTPDLPLLDTCIISTDTSSKIHHNNTTTNTTRVDENDDGDTAYNKYANDSTKNDITDETNEITKKTEYLGEDVNPVLSVVSQDERTLCDAILNPQSHTQLTPTNDGTNSNAMNHNGIYDNAANNTIKHFELTEVDFDFKNIPDTIDLEQPSFHMEDNKDINLGNTYSASIVSGSNNNIGKQNTGTTQLTLKKHKEILYQMYKTAKRKAQEAKKIAIRAYLEAKEIKASYMLDNLEDSDTDGDISD